MSSIINRQARDMNLNAAQFYFALNEAARNTDIQKIAHIAVELNKYASDLEMELKKSQAALDRIARWEMPACDSKWSDGAPMSYEVAWGSQGAKDHIRSIASKAIIELYP